MAGKIIADIIEAPYNRITLNVGNTVVATMNASGLYTSTGNLLITQANQIGVSALNTNVSGTGVAFRGALATNLTVSGNTATQISFNTEQFDTDNAYSSGTFTAPVSGYYQTNVFIAWSGDITGYWNFSWYKNGSRIYTNAFQINTATGSASNHGLSGSDLLYLEAGDTLTSYIYQGSAATKFVTSGGETYASIFLVRNA